MLADMLQQLRPGWILLDQLETVRQTVAFLQEHPHPDLILLDIQLSDGICFSIFEQLEVKSNIIFTTAFDQYAIQAFRVNSIDYLLKPIKIADLDRALVKYEELNLRQSKVELPRQEYADIMRTVLSGQKEYRKRFLVSSGNSYYKLDIKDIACFVSEYKITTAITYSGDHHVLDFSLDRLENELDSGQFFRADRRTIIHIDLVARFEDYFGNKLMVKLKAPVNDRITISRLKASAFKIWLGK